MQGVSLAPLTTFHLGGLARVLVEARTEEAIVRAVSEADTRGEPVLVLGGGSNLVVGDAGFDGLVVRIASHGLRIEPNPSRANEGDAVMTVEAGHPWEDVVARAVHDRLVGVECLAGIPGLTGATPIQNVGAYGQEVADTIARVRAWDRRERAFVELAPAACAFSYRSSAFKRDPARFVVTRVTFALPHGEASAPIRYAELAKALAIAEGARAPLALVRDTVVRLRRDKGMVVDPDDPDTRSAGSFFTNPIVSVDEAQAVATRALELGVPTMPRFDGGGGRVKLAAGWLIEKAGFTKGYRRGRAHVSTKHALALVNDGGTTEEVLALARDIRDGVRRTFGVTLEPEPVLVGCAL
jgi:UDP-N-acetylmuramate dehydrogenase